LFYRRNKRKDGIPVRKLFSVVQATSRGDKVQGRFEVESKDSLSFKGG